MIVDSLVVLIVLISAFIAFLRGVIREVLTIAGVAGGSAAAYALGPLLKPVMRTWFGVVNQPEQAVKTVETTGTPEQRLFGILPYDVVADAVSYGAVFIIVLIVISILSHVLAQGVRDLGLGAVDRTLGFIFGVVRGVLLLGVLYLPVHFFVDQDSKDSWFAGSKTHFFIEKTSGALAGLVPAATLEQAQSSLETVRSLSDTQQHLQNLKPADQQSSQESQKENASGADQEKNSGYSRDFRQDMDRLFQEKEQTPHE